MITTNYPGTLTPAYGRDYTSAKAFKDDFNAGKDFELCTPTGAGLVNIDAFAPGVQIQIRFSRLTKTTMMTVPLAKMRRA